MVAVLKATLPDPGPSQLGELVLGPSLSWLFPCDELAGFKGTLSHWVKMGTYSDTWTSEPG